jgi:hypothetical protein
MVCCRLFIDAGLIDILLFRLMTTFLMTHKISQKEKMMPRSSQRITAYITMSAIVKTEMTRLTNLEPHPQQQGISEVCQDNVLNPLLILFQACSKQFHPTIRLSSSSVATG